MIIRVSGFSGFLPMPRARLNDEANTERNGAVEDVSPHGAEKPENPETRMIMKSGHHG